MGRGRTERLADVEKTLEFIADWAHDCADGDTVFGFADIEARAREALGKARVIRLGPGDATTWPAFVRGYRLGEQNGRPMRWVYRGGIVALGLFALWRGLP